VRYQHSLIVLIGPLVLAGACSRPADGRADTSRAAARATAQAGAPMRDDFGVAIPLGRRPERIVSLNPTTTEILFAIGAGPRLVGRSKWDTFPAAAAKVPSLGDALRPSVEAVLGAHPDLVLLYASADDRAAADRLRQAGITTVSFKIDSITQFARDTRVLGRLTGDSAAADRVVDTVMAALDRVRQATARLHHPTVLVPTWDKPVIVLGGGSFVSQLLDIAGARNVYADQPVPSLTVTLEDVLRRNPDYILVGASDVEKLRTSPQWRAIPAVRNGHVLAYDENLVSRPSVELGAAARSLADLFHPGAVK